jgi:hypothetical protein
MEKLGLILILSLSLFVNKLAAQCDVSITDPDPVCFPETVDLTAAAITDGSTAGLIFTYWTDALATIPYLTPTAATAGTYYIKGDNGVGCIQIKPVVVTVTIPPTATISYSGTPFCTSLTTDQPVTLSGTETYTGGTFNSSEGLSIDPYTGTISPGISTAGTYIVYYSIPSSGGCSSGAVSTSVTVFNSASNNGPVCKGSPLMLTGCPDGMDLYLWSGPNGFTSTEQNPTVSSEASSEMAGIYSLTITDNLGIEHTTSTTVIIRDISTASATSNSPPNSPLCEDEYNEHKIVLTGSPDNMASYVWSGPNGYTWVGRIARVNYEILDETSVAGTYTLTVNDGCSNIRSVTTDVVTYPTQLATLSFPKYICPGASLELKGGPDGMTSYLWEGPGGFSSTEQNPVVVNPVKGYFRLTVTNSFGCKNISFSKQFYGFPPASSCGNYRDNLTFEVCQGSLLQLSGHNVDNSTTALWTGPNGFSSTEWNPVVSTNATFGMAGTYTLTSFSYGCSVPCETIVKVMGSPPVIGNIVQPTCELGTGSVELNTSIPANWWWTLTRLPDNVTLSGTGTSVVTISDIDPGTYAFFTTVGLWHSTCNSIISDNVIISPYPGAPAKPIIGTVTQPNCTVGTGSLILDGLPPTENWTITRMPDGITTKGKGASTIMTGLLPGSYTFIVSTGLKCNSAPSEDVVINMQPLTPSTPVVEIVTQPNCGVPSGSVQLGGLPSEEQWTITMTPGGSVTTGIGTSTTITELTSGTYTFIVTNSSGCTSSPTTKVIIGTSPTVPTAPIVGTITQPTKKSPTGSVVLSGLPAKGNWILTRSDNILITGTGKSTTLKKLAPGSYSWTVTNASGCISGSSANVIINPVPASTVSNSVAGEELLWITSPDNEIQETEISVYPNPVSGQLNIRYSNEDFTTVNILNSSGVIIGKEKVIVPIQQLDFSRFQPGLYILEFSNVSGETIRVKVLKN